ncbi:uncharacterized protein LOC129920699 isoform X1 [Episyrphus balteatus]|uniref:uncharacterized protein LOC129920699 isoform X1 n=1 Tax=Episyrphus balteatus TaxID=286459 RepID=UPI002486C233|nr:uncharacterized protein LOC129920699 isoform X1 [Episyrphus balteatus]
MWKALAIETNRFSLPKVRIFKVPSSTANEKLKSENKKKEPKRFVFSSVLMRSSPERARLKLPGQTRISNLNANVTSKKLRSKWFFLSTAHRRIFLRKGLNYFGSSNRDTIQIFENRLSEREMAIYVPEDDNDESCLVVENKGNCIHKGNRMNFYKKKALFSGDDMAIKTHDNRKLIYFVFFKN